MTSLKQVTVHSKNATQRSKNSAVLPGLQGEDEDNKQTVYSFFD